MSGQYPPPNPLHPFPRPGLQRATPALPPWGNPPQNTGMNIPGSMNIYGSPLLELPNRGLPQQWKPSVASAAAANLFNLPMLGPRLSSAIPTPQTQQDETMDLSNTRLESNGTEVNGEVRDRDSVVTSVIATNPLRDKPRTADSEPKPADLADNTLNDSKLDASTCLYEDMSFHSTADPLPENLKEEKQSLDSFINKNLNVSAQSFDFLNTTDSQPTLSNSLISVDSHDSKLVIAETSAEDIFEMSDKNDTTIVESDDLNKSSADSIFDSVDKNKLVLNRFQNMEKTENSNISKESTASSQSTVSHSSALQASEPKVEPHPSVENVESLLENMFNSQEETSCSSQTSSSSQVPSVIVTNGAKLPVSLPVPKPQVEVVSPMKAEELALTLAEDCISHEKLKEKVKDEPNRDELMDEIEKKLEMLTESSTNTQAHTKPKVEPLENIKSSSSKLTAENVVSVLLSEEDKEDSPINENVPEESKPDEMQNKISTSEKLDKKEQCLDEVGSSLNIKSEQSENNTLTDKKEGTSSNPFIEVESELEKMFAGIVEPAEETNSDYASQPSTSDSKKPAVNKKTVAKRKKPTSRRPSDNGMFGGSSGESTPLKKKGRKRVNDSGSDRGSKKLKSDNSEMKRGRPSKDTNGDSGKVKGPFVHIEGSKLSPASVVVVNSGVRADDEDIADKVSNRRKHSLVQRSEGGGKKTGPVYSSSAMSIRYNSDKVDLTWVCVFCKRGPHCAGGLGGVPAGDLFGPYRIPTIPPHDDIPPSVHCVTDKDLVEEQKRRGGGGKYPKSLRASGGADQFIQKMAKKNKRSGSLDMVEGQAGLLLLDSSYEVWLHELCAEWAPGLCIIGSQLVGLEDAVWAALRTKCVHCGEPGANVSCVVHNCPARVHFPCAVLTNWLLDTDTFIARCHNHRTRLRPS